MQNQIFQLPEVRKSALFQSKGFSNWKKALARLKEHQVSECHKITIDHETFPELAEMCGKCPVMQQTDNGV